MVLTKSTAIAHSNTALIKYWGKRDEELIIPLNNSISMTVDSLTTTTTVEFSEDQKKDEFFLDNQLQNESSSKRIVEHLNLIRSYAKSNFKAKIVSKNNFPAAVGLASSASGFAALTAAACNSLGLKLSLTELSMISRRGSGSSCRSIYGGFVEWIALDDKGNSYSTQLVDENWFDVRDIVLILDTNPRKFNTREAMKISIKTSPFIEARLSSIEKNLISLREAIKNRDFITLGEIAERDCLSMHSVAFTSNPPLIFWTPETVKIIQAIEGLREQGIPVYYTIDTGANMHLLIQPKDEKTIISYLQQFQFIQQIINGKPGEGVKLSNNHLF